MISSRAALLHDLNTPTRIGRGGSEEIFESFRTDVMRATRGDQVPAWGEQLKRSEVYLLVSAHR